MYVWSKLSSARWNDAWEVAAHVTRQYESVRSRTAAFHDALAQIDAMQQAVLGPFQNAGMPDLGDLADLDALGLFGAPGDVIELDDPQSDERP